MLMLTTPRAHVITMHHAPCADGMGAYFMEGCGRSRKGILATVINGQQTAALDRPTPRSSRKAGLHADTETKRDKGTAFCFAFSAGAMRFPNAMHLMSA